MSLYRSRPRHGLWTDRHVARAGADRGGCRRSISTTSSSPMSSLPWHAAPARPIRSTRRSLVVVAVPPTEVGACVAHALVDLARGDRHRRRQRQGDPAGARSLRSRAANATSAATRWPAANGPARWRRTRGCSRVVRGPSPRARRRSSSRSPGSSRLPSWSAPYRSRWMPRRTTGPSPSCPTCRTSWRC